MNSSIPNNLSKPVLIIGFLIILFGDDDSFGEIEEGGDLPSLSSLIHKSGAN